MRKRRSVSASVELARLERSLKTSLKRIKALRRSLIIRERSVSRGAGDSVPAGPLSAAEVARLLSSGDARVLPGGGG